MKIILVITNHFEGGVEVYPRTTDYNKNPTAWYLPIEEWGDKEPKIGESWIGYLDENDDLHIIEKL